MGVIIGHQEAKLWHLEAVLRHLEANMRHPKANMGHQKANFMHSMGNQAVLPKNENEMLCHHIRNMEMDITWSFFNQF